MAVWGEIGSVVAGQVIALAYASSMKKDQEKFIKEIEKLDSEKQAELLLKVQQVQDELERQKIVFQYVDKEKLDKIAKDSKNKRVYLYAGLGLGVVLYVVLMIKLKK